MNERILIIDADPSLRETLEPLVASSGCVVHCVSTGEEALERLESIPVDLVICRPDAPGVDGFDLLPQIARRLPGLPVVLFGNDAGTVEAEAQQRGAYDALAAPFHPARVGLSVTRALEHSRLLRANEVFRRQVERSVGDRPIVAASRPMIDLLEILERAAGVRHESLIVGEPGSGKEIIAQAIHDQSPRRNRSFVTVPCNARPEVVGAMLFGQATSGTRLRHGRFVDADGGTLFFDEIAALPTTLQQEVLAVLQNESVLAPGEDKVRPVDVRVLASTARDLETEVAEGRFDGELFERLRANTLRVPALRDRREDIPLLVDHFLAQFRTQLDKPIRSIADDALERLTSYRWPGNLRELANVIERAVLLSDTERITLRELPEMITSSQNVAGDSPTEDYSLRRAKRSAEAQMIGRALRATNGNRTHAAKLLGISHRALLYKIKDYGVRD